jgi:hypothetical protein
MKPEAGLLSLCHIAGKHVAASYIAMLVLHKCPQDLSVQQLYYLQVELGPSWYIYVVLVWSAVNYISV